MFTRSIDSNPTKVRLYLIPPLCQALHYALGEPETDVLSLWTLYPSVVYTV